MSNPLAFSNVSALSDRGDGRFAGELHPEWTIGGKPHGGYLLAMLGLAAAAVGEHPHVIAASAHYLRSPDPGPVEVEAEVLRTGRSASQVRARLTQEGRACVEALLTTSLLADDSTPYWSAGAPTRSDVQFDDCHRLVPRRLDGMRVAMMENVDVMLEPTSMTFLDGAPDGDGVLRGWLRLPDDEPFDPFSLLFAVDGFPPATFNVEYAGWVPTLELTAYVRALPAPGPVQVLQKAQLIEGQKVDEVCFIWDSAGRLVAQGTQLAGIRLG
ncbi:MAG TPA: thioesterase family protein [Acidimicrobiales bacterium]|nr:thioesterase family protein [Acidimicrobiales bacterium]